MKNSSGTGAGKSISLNQKPKKKPSPARRNRLFSCLKKNLEPQATPDMAAKALFVEPQIPHIGNTFPDFLNNTQHLSEHCPSVNFILQKTHP